MARTVTFVPRTYASADPGDLTYVERISRNRSIHILLEDTTPNRSASRRHFLLKSYREIVARYLSIGRIEHPLPLLRSLVRHFDALSKRVDCRVDDFRGVGLYVLVQDGNSFFLLAGREGRVALRRGGAFQRLETGLVAGVRELPVESASAQKELFSHSLRDFLALYRIEVTPESGPLAVLMGGAGAEIEAVRDAIAEPGLLEGVSDAGTVELALVSHAVMFASFALAEPVRMPPLSLERGSRPTAMRRLSVAGAALAVAAVAASGVWITQRTLDERSANTARASLALDPAGEMALQESPPRLRPAETDPVTEASPGAVDAGEDDPDRVQLALEWSQSLERAVTTTPLLDDTQVIYGARDGRVYAVDRVTGKHNWSYSAEDGVGSSPVAAGRAVVAADYAGNVFSLARETGKPQWKRRLPQKVVSTAVVGGGEVLVGCTDGVAYCLSLETGRVLWKVQTGDRIRGSAAWSNGRFFVPSYDGNVYALASGSGNILWKRSVGASVSSSPAVLGDIVVVGSEERHLYGLDAASGEVRWKFSTDGPVRSFVRAEEGRVYAGCSANVVYCLDGVTGRELWRFSTGGAVLSRPFVRDGVLFVTSYDGNVYCLDAETGRLRDRYATSGEVFSSPVADDEHVYFGNNAGRFYCVRYRGDPAS